MPELDLIGAAEEDAECECEPVPRQPRLQVRCSFSGLHYQDEDEDNKPPGDTAAVGLGACTVFEAVGRASGLVTDGVDVCGEGSGLWLVKGCHAKYLALLHRPDRSVIGGWLETRGGHLTRRCTGSLIDGVLKLKEAGEYVFTASVSGNEMTAGSWRQPSGNKEMLARKDSKSKAKTAAAKAKKDGIEPGFFANETNDVYHPAHPAHPIEREISDRITSWRCDVCSVAIANPDDRNANRSGRRYRCNAGCDFDICGSCCDSSKKGKGTFTATRHSSSQSMRGGGRNHAALIWEVPFTIRYHIECVMDEPPAATAAVGGHAKEGYEIWCLHEDCTESLQTFPSRTACYAHMAAAHRAPLANAVSPFSAVDAAALAVCKPCFEPALSLLRVLHAEPYIRASLHPSAWQSLGLKHQLSRQLDDSLVVATGVLPRWCASLLRNSKELFSKEARHQYFMSTAFGPSRAITWFQSRHIAEAESAMASGQGAPRTPRTGGGPTTIPVLGALKVALVKVSRGKFLQEASQLLATYARDRRELRVEFEGEPGTGKGVWPEFFAKAAAELQRRPRSERERDREMMQPVGAEVAVVDLPALWVADDSEGSGGDFISLELFPRPALTCGISGALDEGTGTLCWYRFIGRLFGKAMIDSKKDCVRLVPLPLHPMFFELLCGNALPLWSATPTLRWKALRRLAVDENWPGHGLILGCVAVASEPPQDGGASVAPYSQGLPVKEWLECAVFEDPVTGAPLKPYGGSIPLRLDNVVEFLDLLFDAWLGDGVERQIEAVRAGFVSKES